MDKWIGQKLYMVLDAGEKAFKHKFVWVRIDSYEECPNWVPTGYYYGRYA